MRKQRDPAWMPPAWETQDAFAIKALANGDATPEQQKRALDWIIHNAGATYDVSYRSDRDGGDRETSFAEGRRFVGLQIVKFVNMPRDLIVKTQSKENGQ